MEIGYKKLEFSSSSDTLTIFALGDLHLASAAFEERQFRQLVSRIQKRRNAIWFSMGDLGENIIIKDARFDQSSLRAQYRYNLHRLPQLEAEELSELLRPIKSKCCGLIEGNHENALRRKFSYDLTWELCNRFGWKHLSSEALYRLYIKWPNRNYNALDIFLAHGYGGGRKWGSKINKLSDIAAGVRADIYLLAHVHSQGAIKEVELRLPAQGKLKLLQKERLGIIVPSFYKTYQEGTDTYASKMLYPPSIIGHSEIYVRYHKIDGIYTPEITTVI